MTVNPDHALAGAHDGEIYYFCSGGCRERFLADADRYLPAPAASTTRSNQ